MVINLHKGKESEIGIRRDCWQEGTEHRGHETFPKMRHLLYLLATWTRKPGNEPD